jgi:hypothetical protein
VKPALHPRTFLPKAHFVVKTAANEGAELIDIEAVEKIFGATGTESTSPETAAAGVVEHEDY